MKGNYSSLVELSKEIERKENEKQDFLVPTKRMEMSQSGESLFFDDDDNSSPMKLTTLAHQQLATKLDIPKKYYDKMQEIPELRAHNVNTWLHLHKKNGTKYLVRTLDRNIRAILSDRYKPLDDAMILSSFLPTIGEMDVKIQSSSLTEKRMYIQCTFPRIQAEVAPGDIVQAGVILTNSEVGLGPVNIASMIWRLVCKNGLIGESLIHKYHTGRRIGDNEEDYNIFADDTIQAEIEAFKLRLRDILKQAISEAYFFMQIDQMRRANIQKIKNISETVENVTKRYTFSDTDKDNILLNLGREKHTRWGLVNSITALAHNIENPDNAYEIERIGHNLLTISDKEWSGITGK